MIQIKASAKSIAQTRAIVGAKIAKTVIFWE